MKASEYLSKISLYETKIERLEDAIKQRPMPGVAGMDYSAPRVDSFPGDRIGSYAAWDVDMNADLRRQVIEYNHLRKEAIRRINALDNEVYVDILMRRYVLYQTWGRIADEMNYSKMHIYKLRKRALYAFEEANYDILCNS